MRCCRDPSSLTSLGVWRDSGRKWKHIDHRYIRILHLCGIDRCSTVHIHVGLPTEEVDILSQGQYSCMATNSAGSSSAIATLTVYSECYYIAQLFVICHENAFTIRAGQCCSDGAQQCTSTQ